MNFFHFLRKDELLDSLKPRDRYHLMGPLGKGTYTDVFSCFDSLLNRVVAMKQLRKEFIDDQNAVRKFINESRLISYIDHPGIVTIYDLFIDNNGLPSYTMNLIPGLTLRSELKSKTRSQLLNSFTKICETLAFVHDKGVIHLDLNPEDIILGHYGEITITDWGNAILYDNKPYEEFLRLVKMVPYVQVDEQVEYTAGNSLYISPEQANGKTDQLSPSSDIFAMGIILYEIMTGRHPFAAKDLTTSRKKISDFSPPKVNEVCPELPSMLSQICDKMLEKDTFDRYHSFHEILIDFDSFYNSGQAFAKKSFKKGQILFKEGDIGNYAFSILEGEVEISKLSEGSKKVLARLGKNEIVGELAIFTNEPRTATVTALQDGTTIRILDRKSVEQEMQKLAPWVHKMVTCLSRRFMQLNDLLIR